jgi:hypothetical protein
LFSQAFQYLKSCFNFLDFWNRQVKLTRSYTNTAFETEVEIVQKENVKILSTLKGDLSIKSAYLLSNIRAELLSLTDTFFAKKFKLS